MGVASTMKISKVPSLLSLTGPDMAEFSQTTLLHPHASCIANTIPAKSPLDTNPTSDPSLKGLEASFLIVIFLFLNTFKAHNSEPSIHSCTKLYHNPFSCPNTRSTPNNIQLHAYTSPKPNPKSQKRTSQVIRKSHNNLTRFHYQAPEISEPQRATHRFCWRSIFSNRLSS